MEAGGSLAAQLLSEQISYIGYPAIINAKFTPEIKRLSIVAAARISNIADLVYSTAQISQDGVLGEVNRRLTASRTRQFRVVFDAIRELDAWRLPEPLEFQPNRPALNVPE